MKPLLFSCFALAALSLPVTSHADTYTYTFTQNGGSAFVLDSPDLVATGGGTANLTSCSYVGGACNQFGFKLATTGPYQSIDYNTSANMGTVVALFTSGTFTKVGTFNDLAGNATLSIVDDSTAVAVTPEPSSLMLLGTGALGMAFTLRRRLVS